MHSAYAVRKEIKDQKMKQAKEREKPKLTALLVTSILLLPSSPPLLWDHCYQ
jgi:hypothetical protein